jgi:hypothetical protein
VNPTPAYKGIEAQISDEQKVGAFHCQGGTYLGEADGVVAVEASVAFVVQSAINGPNRFLILVLALYRTLQYRAG